LRQRRDPGAAGESNLADWALAERCWRETLAELDPRRRMRERGAVAVRGGLPQRIAVAALGKAAGPMLSGWLEANEALWPRLDWVGCALPAGAPGVDPGIARRLPLGVRVYRGGHPLPNARSMAAAEAMLRAARELGRAGEEARPLLVALISGGGSALAERALGGSGAAGLREARRRDRALVASGAPIGTINLVRKHSSAFKGGRLAAAAGGEVRQVSWIWSDVAPGRWREVASGPTCPDGSRVPASAAAWRQWAPQTRAPRMEETPKPGEGAFARATWHCLGGNREACAVLARRLRAAGRRPVVVDAAADEWEEARAAAYLARRWRELRAAAGGGARPALVAGGEVRVRLPRRHGRGGRNQQLALRLALALEGERFAFLSAGTDGIDGNSRAAGACVDQDTAARLRARGIDPRAALAACDAGTALAEAGALFLTGPTGNNLRDLRVLL
jgi:glycerate 2-kinase